jgi:hypothetical protein
LWFWIFVGASARQVATIRKAEPAGDFGSIRFSRRSGCGRGVKIESQPALAGFHWPTSGRIVQQCVARRKPMPAGFEAELPELLGLRLLKAFQNLPSDWDRLQVIEYVEALNADVETKDEPIVRLVTSNRERDEQNDLNSGNII